MINYHIKFQAHTLNVFSAVPTSEIRNTVNIVGGIELTSTEVV